MEAKLIEYFKQDVNRSYVLEVKVWRVKDRRYRFGLKYSLIFLEYKTKKKILMDNHYPKQAHVHINKTEFDYDFKSIDQLFYDFKSLIFKHFGEII